MEQAIKSAKKISNECWNTFKKFISSEYTDTDWDEYINQGNTHLAGYAENSPERQLFIAMYLAFQTYAEAKTKAYPPTSEAKDVHSRA